MYSKSIVHAYKARTVNKLSIKTLSTHPYDASLGLHDGL